MPSTKWLRERYRHLQPDVRKVLMENKHPSSKRHWSYESRLRDVIKKHPDLYPLRSSLISLLREKKRFIEAIQYWHQGKTKFRNKPSPYFQRATWAMQSPSMRRRHTSLVCAFVATQVILEKPRIFGELLHFSE